MTPDTPIFGYDFFTVASYIASVITFVAFFMKAIVPLRLLAIAANVTFLLYAFGTQNYATMLLHLGLLPLNVVRIVQHTRLVRRVRAAIEGEPNIEKLLPLMKRNSMTTGTEIFRKGDWAEEMYFLSEGRVEFSEIGVVIGPGILFGEIALFLKDRARTASAVCIEDCVVYSLSETKVLELVVMDSGFGLFMTKLIAARMNDNLIAARAAHIRKFQEVPEQAES